MNGERSSAFATASGKAWRWAEPRAVWIACALVAVAIGMFIFTLDRYPSSYFDEPWFHVPAARVVDGRSFIWTVDSRAPHAGVLFSPHAPFFPRFQILTFKLLGVSHFACRLPSYLGAHLAVLLLCLLLARRGLLLSAILLALFWIGDKSIEYGLLGRPEGVSHLLVVISFLFLIRAVRRGKPGWLGLAMMALGFAAGFNPGAVFFAPALVLAVGVFVPRRQWRRSLGWMVVGGIPPVALVVWCWRPDVKGSLEQFLWFCQSLTQGDCNLWGMLRWAKGLYACLAALTVGLLPMAARELVAARRAPPTLNVGGVLRTAMVTGQAPAWNCRGSESPSYIECGRRTPCGDSSLALAICATFYALAGLSLFIDPSRRSYYLVFFSVWPMVAFLAFAEKWWAQALAYPGYPVHPCSLAPAEGSKTANMDRQDEQDGMREEPRPDGRGYENGYESCSRRGYAVVVCMLVAGAILFCCWLPSLAWNALRVRESVVLWSALDRSPVIEQLRERIPAGAEVWGSGEYFVMAREAGLVFTPLSMGWEDPGITAPDGAWLVLTMEYVRRLKQYNPAVLEGRRLVYEGVAFRGSRYTEERLVIHGPRER